MGALEIFLIIFGIILVVISFVFGEHLSSYDNKNPEYDVNVAGVTKEIVKKEVEAEVANVIDEKLEQAEVKLDKITNEKIMALGSYSDDVNYKITKNHDEVMFLYDMLSDKEKTIKNTVKDVEALKASIKNLSDNQTDIKKSPSKPESKTNVSDNKAVNRIVAKDEHKNGNTAYKNQAELLNDKTKGKFIDKNGDIDKEISGNRTVSKEAATGKKNGLNSNKEILQMYKEGKSVVEIAQRLGCGVGEVQLVIGLFKK